MVGLPTNQTDAQRLQHFQGIWNIKEWFYTAADHATGVPTKQEDIGRNIEQFLV